MEEHDSCKKYNDGQTKESTIVTIDGAGNGGSSVYTSISQASQAIAIVAIPGLRARFSLSITLPQSPESSTIAVPTQSIQWSSHRCGYQWGG